jgi:hypothetical protein
MPFIGNQPALSYTSFAKQDFTTSATTSYTLDQPVANANELALFINFVRQEPTTAYTASGTTLTLTSATSATDDMYCVFLGKAVQTVNPPAGSVGTSQLANGAVTLAKTDGNFGKVLQVISATDSTERNTTSTSFVNASNTLSVSITPSSASNKIFIIVHTGVFKATGGAGCLTIFRDSTNLGGAGGMAQYQTADYDSVSISYLDSPSSTSALTYQLYLRSTDSNPFYINSNNTGGLVCSLTAFEVAG